MEVPVQHPLYLYSSFFMASLLSSVTIRSRVASLTTVVNEATLERMVTLDSNEALRIGLHYIGRSCCFQSPQGPWVGTIGNLPACRHG